MQRVSKEELLEKATQMRLCAKDKVIYELILKYGNISEKIGVSLIDENSLMFVGLDGEFLEMIQQPISTGYGKDYYSFYLKKESNKKEGYYEIQYSIIKDENKIRFNRILKNVSNEIIREQLYIDGKLESEIFTILCDGHLLEHAEAIVTSKKEVLIDFSKFDGEELHYYIKTNAKDYDILYDENYSNTTTIINYDYLMHNLDNIMKDGLNVLNSSVTDEPFYEEMSRTIESKEVRKRSKSIIIKW